MVNQSSLICLVFVFAFLACEKDVFEPSSDNDFLFTGVKPVELTQEEDGIICSMPSEKSAVWPGFRANEMGVRETNTNLLSTIYENLHFPASCNNQCLGGVIVASITISKEGNLTSKKLIRDLGSCGLGDAVLSALDHLPAKDWTPGTISGVPVDIAVTIPIRIKLE